MPSLEYKDLQLDIKAKIFSLLTPSERQLARGVCLDWKNVIEEEFGLKLVVNNNSVDVLERAGKNARELHLNSLTVPIASIDMSFSPKLTTLKFFNIVVTYNLIPLLRQYSSSLIELSFNQIIVDLPHQLQILILNGEEKISLAKLETLEINEWNLSDSLAALLDMLMGGVDFGKLKNISFILQNPPMIPLQLLFQEEGQVNPLTIPSYLQILKNNIETVEVFKYGRPIANTLLKFHPWASDSNAHHHPIQIRELLIYSQFKSDWLPMLLTQRRLEKIHIGDCRVGMWEGIRNTVRDNAATLETFWIGGQSFNQQWDFNAFAGCTKLRKICTQLYMSPKINMRFLPSSTLTHINFSGSIKRDEILTLLEKLEVCEDAEFSHLGINQVADGFDDHLSLELFLRFMRLPKLKRISFLHCDWNEVDWDGVIQWCTNNVTQGIFFEQLFYPLHGQEIRHGIHVKILPTFDHSAVARALESDQTDPVVNISDGVCHTVYSLLTSWL